MKFEELYKQANDNIHADKNIIDRIYSSEHKKSYFSFKMATACVAVMIAVFSVSVLPYFYNTHEKTTPEVVYNTDASPEKEECNTDGNIAVVNDTSPKSPEEDIGASVDSVQPTNDNIKVFVDEYTLPDAEEEKKFKDEGEAQEKYSDAETSAIMQPKIQTASAGGGGGTNFGNTTNTLHMTYKEYAEYLTWDISDYTLSVPGNMKLNLPDEVSVISDKATGEIIADSAQFNFVDPDNPYAYLGVSASLTGCNVTVSDYPSSPEIINNAEVFVKQNDALTEAYAKLGDVWLQISSIDVSDEEFDAFLKSLIKNN